MPRRAGPLWLGRSIWWKEPAPARTAKPGEEVEVLAFLQPTIAASAQNPVNLPGQVGPTLTAEPLTVGEKFDYRIVQSYGLRGFAGEAVGAAIAQGRDVPREWGEGWGAYATRYAAGFGTNLARQSIAFGL
jgi:hypothetical protein